VYGTTYLLMFLGMMLVFVGALLIFVDAVRRVSATERLESERRVDVGGAVIVGPIPIVFGSNKRITKTMLVLAIVLTALVILLTLMNYLLVVR